MRKPISRPRRQLAENLAPRDYGYFNESVRARWLSDGRYMALCGALEFHQHDGPTWTAPIGTRTDGASIPPVFWSVIGGPFEGKYRDASVVHDYECCIKVHAWRDVHRMFFAGMMANGEARWRAKLMYFAVYFFGPRWPPPEKRPDRKFTEGDVARAAKLLQQRPAMALEEIENLTRPTLRAKIAVVPRSIVGAAALSDTRKIKPVDRDGPCIEPGKC
jgi:hypothetical protein